MMAVVKRVPQIRLTHRSSAIVSPRVSVIQKSMVPTSAVFQLLCFCGFAVVALLGPIDAQAQTQASRLKKVRLAIPSLSGSNMPVIVARDLGSIGRKGSKRKLL